MSRTLTYDKSLWRTLLLAGALVGLILGVSAGAWAQTAPTLIVSPTSVPRGGTVPATWAGIPNPTPRDWLGLYTPGASNTAYLAWIYVSCTQSPGSARAAGSCAFPVPTTLAPGTYELRLLANNGFTRLATSNAFTVTGGGVTLAWDDTVNTTHDGYLVLRRDDIPSSVYTEIASTDAAARTYTDTGVGVNPQVCYVVEAFRNEDGAVSLPSNEVCTR